MPIGGKKTQEGRYYYWFQIVETQKSVFLHLNLGCNPITRKKQASCSSASTS